MVPYPPMSSTYIPPSNAATARAAAQPVTHLDPSAHERWSCNSVIDLTGNEDDDAAGPPAKRQKIDTESDNVSDIVHIPNSTDNQTPTIAPNLVNVFPVSGLGRPPWSFGDALPNASVEGSISARSLEGSQQHPQIPLPPFPVRPWTHARPQSIATTALDYNYNSVSNQVQTVPYSLETPKAAPTFGSDKVADFYPWRGSHPEDVLNEQTAKHGYFDHVQVSQNESNTARPSLYAQFKHRSGLKILSSVFSMALERRQAHTKVAETSTFKPPPRVTLTDTKREAWLRDLANPSVPLRRLSRTIPHGIRGKGLLDQCLAKNIPIGRAVWLAKCVGANEIRAFKRKGTTPAVASGLESKWVRDWTVNVIQFLEGVIGGCGVDGWRAHLRYAVSLSSRLFHENLLDQDYFLEWLLSSLENSSLEVFPIWLGLVGIYWKNLVGYRKRGRRIAECLLERLHVLTSSGHGEKLKPLSERLSCIVNRFILSHPACFILPKTWSKYESALAESLDLSNPEVKSFFVHMCNRNTQVGKAKNVAKDPLKFPTRRLIHILDCATGNCHNLASESLKLGLDHKALISTVLLWASTTFRCGLSRVYVAAKLLRRWNRTGIDTDSYILDFLINHHQFSDIRFTNVYHIIAELIRSQSFSVGKYLQWLVARGAITKAKGQGDLSRDIELLSHIPSRPLPEHVWNHRNMLLSRTGYSISAETQLIDRIKRHINNQLSGISDPADESAGNEETVRIDFPSLNWTVRCEIAHHVREHICFRLKDTLPHGHGDASLDRESISAITPQQFYHVRYFLECIEDLYSLADVLKQVARSNRICVLIAALDTFYYHFDAFSAIGATNDLFQVYVAQYTRIATSDNATVELTSSLLEIAVKLPAEIATISALRRELARLDSKYAMAASSPVSDHMPNSLDPINPTFSGTLDQLLASGSGIDEPTMVRVFDLLLKMLTSNTPADTKLSSNDAARYLARLRTFNSKLFDSLMLKWVVVTLTASSPYHLSSFLPPLIGVGCIAFEALFTLVRKLLNSRSKQQEVPNPAWLRFEVLRLLGMCPSSSDVILDLVSYRYRTAREEFVSRHTESIMDFINDTLGSNPEFREYLVRDDSDGNTLLTSVTSLIAELIVKSSKSPNREPATSILHDFPNCQGVLRQAVDLLLGSQTQTGLEAAQETLRLINDFSLPCCLIKFQLLCDAETDSETKARILDMVFRAAESDIRHGIPRWIDVVSVLSPQNANQVRQRAVQALLSHFLLDGPQAQVLPQETGEVCSTSEQAGFVYLLIVEQLGWTIPDGQPPSLGGPLVEKLGALFHRVTINSTKQPGAEQPSQGTFVFWFYVLLRLVTIHRSTSLISATSRTDIADQTRLLLMLCCIVLSPLFTQRLDERCHIFSHVPTILNTHQLVLPPTWRALRTYALDVASSLVDTLPDEARQQCARILRDRCSPIYHPQSNPYLLYLFGPLPESPAQALVAQQAVGSSAQAPSYGPIVQQPQTQAQTPPTQTSSITLPTSEDPVSSQKLQFQQGGRILGPCPPRPWEMLEESAPILGVNDTALNLAYFGARQVRG